MRIKELKNGTFVLEISTVMETLTDSSGTVAFIYLKKEDLEKLEFEAWTALFDQEIRRAIK